MQRNWLAAPRIADVIGGRKNNFNLMRFVAASMVIFLHELSVTQAAATIDPIFWLTRGRDDSGSLAVVVFFVISGFLITQSFVSRNGNLLEFFGARALRILPGLWVAIPFTIIVSSFASPVPWGRYLTSPLTLQYWFNNSILWNLKFALPGAFKHVPLAHSVNGSLWTLPLEARMYVVCAVLGLLGIYVIRPVFNAFFLTILTVCAMTRFDALPIANNPHASKLAIAFFFGAACYINRNELRLSLPVALLLLIPTYFVTEPLIGRIYVLPAIVYLTLCLGLHPALFFRPFTRIGDYSYGLYIYAFPLQQQMVFYHPGINWLVGLALTFPIILGVAVLSWHFIEKPALRLKRYLNWDRRETSHEPRLTVSATGD